LNSKDLEQIVERKQVSLIKSDNEERDIVEEEVESEESFSKGIVVTNIKHVVFIIRLFNSNLSIDLCNYQ
jgi:hypothetical protein